MPATLKDPWQMTRAEYIEGARAWRAEYKSQLTGKALEAELLGVAHGHKRHVENALGAGKPVSPEVLADYPDLKPAGVAPEIATGTRWQQAQAQAIARIEEIESEWVAKRFSGPTKEQQDRIYSAIADTAKEYGVPESTLQRAVLWEARAAGAKPASLTAVEYDRQYSLSELKSKARAAGISTSGDKKALCRKLIDAGVA